MFAHRKIIGSACSGTFLFAVGADVAMNKQSGLSKGLRVLFDKNPAHIFVSRHCDTINPLITQGAFRTYRRMAIIRRLRLSSGWRSLLLLCTYFGPLMLYDEGSYFFHWADHCVYMANTSSSRTAIQSHMTVYLSTDTMRSMYIAPVLS